MKITLHCLMMVLAISCKPKAMDEQAQANAAADSAVYFPVQQYILEQVKDVDSTPYYLYMITEKNNRRDSVRLEKNRFDQMAAKFSALDTNDTLFKRNYQENIFEDQSTGSITFTYSAKNKELPVQNITVLLNSQNERVKRIFATIVRNAGDSSIIEKLGWKADESFSVNRVTQLPGQPDLTETNTIVWNKKD